MTDLLPTERVERKDTGPELSGHCSICENGDGVWFEGVQAYLCASDWRLAFEVGIAGR